MIKPRVFISSTIYDFQDLRSALKCWLEELGYEVLESESCDFDKDSSRNSYDACLEVISQCDYFILFIGGRVGGWYDENISITRREYQVAYEAAQNGQVKRIISFVRQCIFDVLEDRQALIRMLKDLDIQENGQPVDKVRIAYHDSKLVNGAAHIKSFIDEVSRKSEFKEGEKPNFNWINSFQAFEDIVNVLKIELRLKGNLARMIAERNIKSILAKNLSALTEKENGRILASFMSFQSIRNQLAADRERTLENPFNYQICLQRKEIGNVFEAVMFYEMGVYELDMTILENAVISGSFLAYSKSEETYVETGVNRALKDMIYEIKRLQRHVSTIEVNERQHIFELYCRYRDDENTTCLFPYHQLANFVVPYECKYNILELTKYIFLCFKNQNDSLDYPLLLHGLADAGHPTEEEILEFFEK